MNYFALIIAIIGIAGTLLGIFLTQQNERKRMREQHGFDLADEYMRWTRDRRADLYLRTTTHYLEAQNSQDEITSNMREILSISDRAQALAARSMEKKVLLDKAKASGDKAPVELLAAEIMQSDSEMAEIKATADQLNDDREPLQARFDANYKRLSDELMELQLFGSREVQRLAGEVFDEIQEIGRINVETTKPEELDSKVLYKALYEKWAQLLTAMREELKISD